MTDATQQSKAIELAEWIEGVIGQSPFAFRQSKNEEIAAELRRLDAVERESKTTIEGLEAQVWGLKNLSEAQSKLAYKDAALIKELKADVAECRKELGWRIPDHCAPAEAALDWSKPLQTSDGDRLEHLCIRNSGTHICRMIRGSYDPIVEFDSEGRSIAQQPGVVAINVPAKTTTVWVALWGDGQAAWATNEQAALTYRPPATVHKLTIPE